MFDIMKMAAAAVAGAAVIAAPAYVLGRADGKREAAISTLEKSITVLRERGEIDAEISSSTAGSLCAHYGLSDDDTRECVRRLETSNHDAGNSAVHHDQGPAIR